MVNIKPIYTTIKETTFTKGGKLQIKKIVPAKKADLPNPNTPVVICSPSVINVLKKFYSLFEKGLTQSDIETFLNQNLTDEEIAQIQEVRKDVQ
jgi:hypothetical protein